MELRRDLGLRSLTLAVVTGTIGSGWLLASYFAARSAGAASLPAWLIGGAIAFLLACYFKRKAGKAAKKAKELGAKAKAKATDLSKKKK